MLRTITAKGFEILYKAYQSGEYPEYFRNFEDFLNMEQFAAYMQTCGSLTEVVDGTQIQGFVTLAQVARTRIALPSILILKDHQHKGVAVSAFKEIGDWVFKKGFLRIICVCSRDDDRTMKLLEKAHFFPEARMRGNCFYKGRLHDEMRFSLPREQWRKFYQNQSEKE